LSHLSIRWNSCIWTTRALLVWCFC